MTVPSPTQNWPGGHGEHWEGTVKEEMYEKEPAGQKAAPLHPPAQLRAKKNIRNNKNQMQSKVWKGLTIFQLDTVDTLFQ